MTDNNALATFASNFVQQHYRDRFLHEAVKKPMRLSARICHELSGILLPQYRCGRVQFSPADKCFSFTKLRFEATTWGEAMRRVDAGGGGHLIIDGTGRKFFADSEGFPPPETYAGGA